MAEGTSKPTLESTLESGTRLVMAVRLVWRASRRWTLWQAGLVALQGLLPLAGLVVLKRIVDAVSRALTSNPGPGFDPVVPWLVLAGVIALVSSLARSLSELAQEAQSALVTEHVSRILHEQSIAVDLAYYEDPRYHDTLHRAQREAAYRPNRIVNGLIQIGQSSLALAGITVLVLSLDWLVGILLLAAAFPGMLVRLFYSRRLFLLHKQQTARQRRTSYYTWLITSLHHAAIIRLLGVGRFFSARAVEMRDELNTERLRLSRSRVLADTAGQAMGTTAIFGALALICYKTVAGAITLGGLAMYYQAFQSGLGFLQTLLRGLAGLYEDSLFLADFQAFLAIEPRIRGVRATSKAAPDGTATRIDDARGGGADRFVVPPSGGLLREGYRPHGNCRPLGKNPPEGGTTNLSTPSPPDAPAAVGGLNIRFDNVSFTYPGRPKKALDGINFEVPAGRIVALAGENGAGKTTLVKLLTRLYDPDEGSILANGVDLREMDPAEWRSQVSVVSKDYAGFQLTARENIWAGNVQAPISTDRIQLATTLAGAEKVIERLPQGYESLLGRQFEDGVDISAGEWQRLSIARALFREAPLLVLDEPTSSLDPFSEANFLTRLRDIIGSRSAVLISHRFTALRLADLICVIEEGRVIEKGTHDELIRRNGQYARLFGFQARLFGTDAEVDTD